VFGADERIDCLRRRARHVEPAFEADEHHRAFECTDVAGVEVENLHRIHG